MRAIVPVLSLYLLLAGCTSTPQRNAVPVERAMDAVVAGMPPDVRVVAEMSEAEVVENLSAILEQKRAAGIADNAPMVILALSGGGANGAFGAGLLAGWTKEGSRPEFDVVTGISTGALIAPFAFLGSRYDAILEKFYTGTDTSGVIEKRSALAALRGDAVSDSGPLRRHLENVVDEKLLSLVAGQHRLGRRLLVGTTNLDAGRGVLWDMGAIASSGQPGALQLFRNILLASASVPVAFPPVYFDVEVDGEAYSEMHVDGGIAAQAFIYPLWMELGKLSQEEGLSRQRSLYVIRNSTLLAQPTVTRPSLAGIAGRSMGMLTKQQGFGDLVRIYAVARRDELDFHLAFIPQDVQNTSSEPFDPVYMKMLFDLGFGMASSGYPWEQDLLRTDEK